MSTLNVSNITDGTTTVGTGYVVNGSAKAWVNFNGVGTVAVKDSNNTSSITDNTTGSFTQSFTSSFANTNYTAMGSNIVEYAAARGVKGIGIAVEGDESISLQTASAVKLYSNYGATASSNGGAGDFVPNFVHCMGDLA